MPVKTRNLGVLAARQSVDVPLLDDPLIGHLQAIILKKLEQLGAEAFGYKVFEQLCIETGVWIDVSQIYSSIRKLADRDPPLIEQDGPPRRSPDGGPPLKYYKLTAAGRAALKSTAAHHRAVADYLEGNKRKATRT